MGLLDVFTGGKSGDAAEAMRKAEEAFANLKVPTQAELSLPELQKYVEAGIMTPAQAQAVLQASNAYDTTPVPTEGRSAELGALNQLQDIANNKGMDATEAANFQNTINNLNTAAAGQKGAILDSFAQRGVPLSLAAMVQQQQAVGQDASQANANALQGNADAQMRALTALQGVGNMGSNIQGQDWNQANTKAAAQNAINQWNSQVANNVNQNNAGRSQEANTYNAQNKQNVSNANTGTANARTEYNAQVPQTIYGDAIQKATGEAGAFTNIGNMAQKQGEQTQGIIGGAIGAAAPMLRGSFAPSGGAGTANVMGSQVGTYAPSAAEMGMSGVPFSQGGVVEDCYKDGGMVPGHAQVPGDSPMNDTVPARLSPGELVVPRSLVHEFVRHMTRPKPAVHPDDVTHVLHALTNLRQGAA